MRNLFTVTSPFALWFPDGAGWESIVSRCLITAVARTGFTREPLCVHYALASAQGRHVAARMRRGQAVSGKYGCGVPVLAYLASRSVIMAQVWAVWARSISG